MWSSACTVPQAAALAGLEEERAWLEAQAAGHAALLEERAHERALQVAPGLYGPSPFSPPLSPYTVCWVIR